MSPFVSFIVGQFDLFKSHLAGHPVLPGSGRVGVGELEQLVVVHVPFAHHNPLGVEVFVSVVARWGHFCRQSVFRILLEAAYAYDKSREHPPSERIKREGEGRDCKLKRRKNIMQPENAFHTHFLALK